MTTRIFNVPSLEGEDRARTISATLRRVPGIVAVKVDVANKQVSVDFDSALINEVQVIQALRTLGYDAE